jgi:hypothetical protein
MPNQATQQLLTAYDPISLTEMDNVKLMDRTDLKYVFSIQQLAEILTEIKPFYRVLEVNGTRVSKYETLYYDTETLDLYSRHHCGKMNRYKMRSRKYVESDLHFFEVKYKNNRGRTIKNRIKTTDIESKLSDRSKELLKSITDIDPATLKPAIWVNYSRVTLVNKSSSERLTIDIGLHFVWNDKRVDMDNLVIAEVKQDKANSLSPIVNVLKQKRIHQGSISKYCLGIASIYDNIRKNNFKEKIRNINKLLYAA